MKVLPIAIEPGLACCTRSANGRTPCENRYVSEGSATTAGCVDRMRSSQLVPLRRAPTMKTKRPRSGLSDRPIPVCCPRPMGMRAASARAHRGPWGDSVLALPALAVVVAAVVVTVPLLHGQSLLSFTADDAYITFRYADHLADGHGPVWNLVGPRADGYTSPLWMTLIAATDVVGIGNEAASKVLSLLAAAAIVAILTLAGGRRAPLARTVAIAALVVSPAFMAITVQGLETTTAALFATCTALALVAALRRPG